MKENLHISEFQSGHSVIENLSYTKSLISYFKAEIKTLLMSLYDFKTYFDSLWLENTLIDLFFNGIDNECLNLLYSPFQPLILPSIPHLVYHHHLLQFQK